MTNTVLLNEYIKKSGLKLYCISEKMGLSRFGFANKVKGKNEFTASEIEKLCAILNIDSLEDRQRIFFAKEVEINSTEQEAKGH